MTAFTDNAPDVFAAVCTLAVFACIVFPLRLYIRLSRRGAWGYDDWFMSVGFIPFAALTISCLAGSFHGVGVHQHRLSDQEKQDGMKWFFLFEVFFCIAIIFIKLSISFMLARIAAPVRVYVYALWTASALVTIMNLIALLYIIFQCSPVSYAWDQSGEVDWFCAFLPIPLLRKLNMDRKNKISIAILLSLGVLASLSACIRLKYTVNLNNSHDFLYAIGDVVIWGYAENAIGLIVGCVSTLRPLFVQIFNPGQQSGNTGGDGKAGQPLGAERYEMGDNGRARKGGSAIMKSMHVRQNSGKLASDSEEELVDRRGAAARV